jgi:hypothetical protein
VREVGALGAVRHVCIDEHRFDLLWFSVCPSGESRLNCVTCRGHWALRLVLCHSPPPSGTIL